MVRMVNNDGLMVNINGQESRKYQSLNDVS